MQQTIYRIDTDHRDLKGKAPYREVVDYIINNYNSKIKDGNLPDEIKDASIIGEPIELERYSEILLYRFNKYSKPAWFSFLPIQIDEDDYSNTPSFICFFLFTENLLVATGGTGFQIIRSYIDYNFGIDLAVRLIDEKSNIIHEIQEQDILGNALSRSTQFKSNQTLFDVERFAKIFSKIVAEINKAKLKNKLGIDNTRNLKNTSFESKTGFKLKKSILFDELYRLTSRLNSLIQETPTVELNKINRIDKKEDKYSELTNILVSELYSYIQGNNDKFDFEIIHAKNKQSFINAESYLFELEGNEDLSFNNLKDLKNNLFNQLKIKNEESLRNCLFNGNLIGINGVGKDDTKGKLISHIQTEIKDRLDRHYFHINASWWYIKDTFVQDINEKSAEIIKKIESKEKFLSESWEKNLDEGEYNNKYANMPNYIVLDRKLREGIELCDILHQRDDKLYLIHTKRGFDRNLRVLSSQIDIASQRLSYSLKDDKEYLKKVYQSLSKNNKVPNYTESDFINLFEENKIIFVMAFSTNKKNIKDEIKKIRSSIAKFSVIELFQKHKSYDFGLELYLIKE